jgi:AraC-like DNA-binding protein
VRHAIAQRLLTGAAPTLDAVAAACRLAPRTLRDRLARQGLGFRQLLDDVRRDLAREHLASGLSVNETAYLLGFSEPAAFQHACRRWFGVAAGEVRRQARL